MDSYKNYGMFGRYQAPRTLACDAYYGLPDDPYMISAMQSAGNVGYSGMWTPYEGDMDYEAEADLEYLRGMYPEHMKRIQRAVEEECDRHEYEGSPMYDEYPDRFAISRMGDRVYQNLKTLEAQADVDDEEDDVETTACRNCGRPGPDQWLRNAVEVMLLQEIYRRRCLRRNCRPWFY